jgi:outer membrane cobalamin receptor
LTGKRLSLASFFDTKGEAFLLNSARLVPHILAVLLVCFLQTGATFSAAAQPSLPTPAASSDTSAVHRPARSYAIDEVVVTSQRIPRPVLYSPSASTVVSRRLVEQSGGTSLGTVLEGSAGLFVKDYGDASGIKTIAQRGMGTEHTLLLINGMPVNSVQSGGADLGMTSADDIDRIEVVHGGQSALHGSSAVAGIINVITRAMPEDEHASAGISLGSFGYRQFRLAVGNGITPATWQVRYARERNDGDYPFEFRNGPVTQQLVRTNADLRIDRLSATLRAPLSARTHLSSYAAFQDGERGVPGVVAGPYSSSRARQQDRQALLQASFSTIQSPAVSWETRVQGLDAYQRYRDPDLVIGFATVDNYYRSREARLESRVTLESPWGMRVNAGGDLVRTTGESNAHREDGARTQWALALAGEQRLLGTPSDFSIVLYPALRYDHAGAGLEAWSPQAGMYAQMPLAGNEGGPRTTVRLRGNISRNFRPPTFNELYYAGGGGIGNPDLRPERSTSVEGGGGVSTYLFGEHHLDVTAFAISMNDRIVWVPAGIGSVTPRNIRQVQSRGVECTYSMASGGAALTAHYTRSRSEKASEDYPGDANTSVQLIYSPEEMFGLAGSWTFAVDAGMLTSIDCSAGYTFTGHRFTTEDNSQFLPAYRLWRAGCGVRLHVGDFRMLVRGEVTNLLDESYEVMAGYPMPPRTAKLSVEILY